MFNCVYTGWVYVSFTLCTISYFKRPGYDADLPHELLLRESAPTLGRDHQTVHVRTPWRALPPETDDGAALLGIPLVPAYGGEEGRGKRDEYTPHYNLFIINILMYEKSVSSVIAHVSGEHQTLKT